MPVMGAAFPRRPRGRYLKVPAAFSPTPPRDTAANVGDGARSGALPIAWQPEPRPHVLALRTHASSLSIASGNA